MTPETQVIRTDDGCDLAADLYRGPSPRLAVIISAGTGFPRQFYAAAARHLAAKGAVVMTYDYRGIGASRGEGLRGSPIEYTDWGRHDLPAVIDALGAAAPGLPITHLAHSVGGHFIGLAPNQAQITRHAFVSVGSGYWAHHHAKNIPLELVFWWLYGPYLLARHGYIKSGGLWTGEDLPPRVFKTWRRWCRQRAYFNDEIETTPYDNVRAPIASWVFPDDPIATPRTAQHILDVYAQSDRRIIHRSAAELGVKRIGHEGAFRKGREALWDEWWEWLAQA